MKVGSVSRKPLFILACTLLAFMVMGYHPGAEDDGVYLAAIKADLQPGLFPHDSSFFRLQLQATVFDRWIADFVAITHIPVPWAELLWQLIMLYGTLWAAHTVARKLFKSERAQCAGVVLLAAMFTLPVAGTALYIADQHLHPRNAAMCLIVLAIARILEGRFWSVLPLLFVAFLLHPIMAALGISFCCVLALVIQVNSIRQSPVALAVFAPLSTFFEPPSPAWRQALETRSYYFLWRWTWYEWLGAIAPLVLFGILYWFAKWRGNRLLSVFALAVVIYGLFQQAVALVMLGFPAFVRLTPLQPMRYLHLVYLFMVLMAGCLTGEHLLKRSVGRWVIFIAAACGCMFASQRTLYPSSPHLELPGRSSHNPWLEAFAWIRQNTPTDAYFAVDPNYLTAPGEDAHGFRALAERSQLADLGKDAAVVTQVPQLGPAWAREVKATAGWQEFKLADFQRLKREFGVNWVLVTRPATSGLSCLWSNHRLAVCRIP